jgi:hemerythrin-like domain-containing protein
MVESPAVWHAEHVNFARLLDLLDAQVTAFHHAAHPNYDLMSNILYYLRRFDDGFHHLREDVAFARLIERDPGMRLPINRLLQEHRVIATTSTKSLEIS